MAKNEELKSFGENDRYTVNQYGACIDSHTTKYLPALKDRYGNKVVAILEKGEVAIKRVDRIVAHAFLEEPAEGITAIKHKDKKKSNCAASNLEWFDTARLKDNQPKGYI